MSRYNYNSLQNTAGELITKFGSEYRFERQCDRSYNPETGKPFSRNIVYTKNAVVSDFSSAEVAQNIVQQGDIKLLAEAENYEISDTVMVGCDTYRIIDISTIQGSNQRLAVYLHLRK
jgi:hypothetical protein